MEEQYQQTTNKPAPEVTRVKVKRLSILSLGVNSAILGIMIGIIQWLLWVLFIKVIASSVDPTVISGVTDVISIGLAAGIIPITALLGFISGIIFALMYNLTSKITKGIVLDLEEG